MRNELIKKMIVNTIWVQGTTPGHLQEQPVLLHTQLYVREHIFKGAYKSRVRLTYKAWTLGSY